MKKLLLNISKLFWPELKSFPHARQLVGVGDVFSSLYSTFIYGIGIYWLILETEFQLIINEWKILLFFFVLTSLLSRLTYFMIIEFREDRYGVSDGSFDSMMTWTNVFIFGAIGIWPIILDRSFTYLLNFRKGQTKQKKWDSYRNFSLTLAGFTIPYLVGLNIYSYYGGVFPIRNLDTNTLIASLLAIIINFITLIIIWLPYFMYSLSTQKALVGETQTQPVFKFFLQAISIPTLAHPFSILISNIYVQNNLLVFLFLILGVIGVSYFAMQFSRVAEKSRQKSRQLEKLEQLGRAFLGAPPDISALSDILSKYIPNMFPSGNISIWIIPGQTIYQSPADWQKDFGPIWNWVDEQVTVNGILANTPLPWETNNDPHRPVICSPIMSHEGDQVIGGIYLELRQLSQSWDSDTLSDLYPGIQTLGDLISSAIHHSEEYARSIAYEKVDQEIQLAGQIQASFLPNQFPSIPEIGRAHV